MNKATFIPAVPGTYVTWYNHCQDTTNVEAVLFWCVDCEPGDEVSAEFYYARPVTISQLSGEATVLRLPEHRYPEDDPRHEQESVILGYDIPGWGFISLTKPSPVYGSYKNQAKGYHPFMDKYSAPLDEEAA